MQRGFIISLIIAAFVGVFALNNSELVEINLLFTSVLISQAIVIFLSAILGAVIVALLGWFSSLKLKKEIRELNKNILVLEDDKMKLLDLINIKEDQIKELYQINTNKYSNNKEI